MIFGNQAARFARQGIRNPIDFRRGGRAVDCTGLENRQAERPREFESHPLRHIDSQALILRAPKNITDRHNKPSEFSLVRPCSRTSRQFRPERIRGFGKVALCWSDSAMMPQFAAKADRTPARNSSPHSGLMKKAAAPAANAFQRTIRSSFAVRTMTLVEGEIPLSRLWTSKPSIRGIHISITATLG